MLFQHSSGGAERCAERGTTKRSAFECGARGANADGATGQCADKSVASE